MHHLHDILADVDMEDVGFFDVEELDDDETDGLRTIRQYESKLISKSLPVSYTGMKCPICNGSMKDTPLPLAAYHREYRAVEYPVLFCEKTDCAGQYTCTELLQIATSHVSQDLVDVVRCALDVPIKMDDVNSNALIAKMLWAFQVHRYSHAKSCFKTSKRTEGCKCWYRKIDLTISRFLFPKLVSDTRPNGHQYVNAYSFIIAVTMRMNHDIQILIGAGGVTQARYCTKYATSNRRSETLT